MSLKQTTKKSNLGFIKALFIAVITLSTTHTNAADRIYGTSDACFQNQVLDAFALGERIAYGDNISRKYESLLYGTNIDPNVDVVEPLQVAYGFYVISERLGDARARARQDWVMPYMTLEMRDNVASAIYKKYSAAYIKKCFGTSISNINNAPKTKKELKKENNFYLYMHSD